MTSAAILECWQTSAVALPGLRVSYWLLLHRVALAEDGVPLTALYHGGHCDAASAQRFFRWAIHVAAVQVVCRHQGKRGRSTVRLALTAKARKLLNPTAANQEPTTQNEELVK